MYNLTDKLKNLVPYEPIAGEYKIRLDANESYFSLDKSMLHSAVEKLALNRYPDPNANGVCEAFARYYGIKRKHITAGNGSDELISVICNSFLQKGDSVLTLSPDFSMYRFYAELSEVKVHNLPKNDDLQIEVDAVIDYINQNKINCLMFSNPCNPTSLGLKKSEVRRLISSVNALVILDEAYMDFWNESLIDEVQDYDNVILLRTASKAFAMAGIRLGFAVANEKLTNAIRAAKSPYNVNTITQTIGELVLSDENTLRSNIEDIKQSIASLYSEIIDKNYVFLEKVYEPKTNFVFIKTSEAKEIQAFFEKNSIAIRAFDGYLRITCGTTEENKAVIKTLDEYNKK